VNSGTETLYSRQGPPEFNRMIAEELAAFSAETAQAVGSDFIALILGGGYGRGEGACVIREGKPALYNDLDFFIVTRRGVPLPPEVAAITRRFEQRLGIEIDIGRPLTPRMLARLPHELMWQDLYHGHLVTAGDPQILRKLVPGRIGSPLPRIEALRLMLNRGSGLLQAIMHAGECEADSSHQLPDGDFIRRNREKALLAFGDALLIMLQRYPQPLAQRPDVLLEAAGEQEERLRTLMQATAELYREAVGFKLRPDSLPPEQPETGSLVTTARLWAELLLVMEELRTGRTWPDASAYARDPFIRERGQHRAPLLIRNGLKNLMRRRISLRYPREELYRSLPPLLADPQPHSRSWRRRSQEFVALWQRYN
jgi:hypothetical protein